MMAYNTTYGILQDSTLEIARHISCQKSRDVVHYKRDDHGIVLRRTARGHLSFWDVPRMVSYT